MSSLDPNMWGSKKPQQEVKTTPAFFDDSTFIGGIVNHVVLPKLVDLAFNTGVAVLEKACYGKIGATRHSKTNYNSLYSMTDYNRIGSGTTTTPLPGSSLYGTADRHRAKMTGRKWYCENIDQMDNVMSEMQIRLDAGGKLSVADMCDIFDVSNPASTTNNFGWVTLEGVQTYRDLDTQQWVIELPKPRDIRTI